jgi:hypothetical protein
MAYKYTEFPADGEEITIDGGICGFPALRLFRISKVRTQDMITGVRRCSLIILSVSTA